VPNGLTSAEAARILIIDDEPAFARVLAAQLEARGHQVTVMADGAAAIEAYPALSPDVVVLDLAMPWLDGFAVLGSLRELDPAACVILLSGVVDVPATVRALRMGAQDVLTKPVDHELLNAAITKGLQHARLMQANQFAKAQAPDPYGFLDDSPAMRRVIRSAENLAGISAPVLITGELGTGKRFVAEMLHQLSKHADRPFVRIAGDGTGAAELLDALHGSGGTLFVQNISVMPPDFQRLLMSTLPRSEFRVIASTERDLGGDARSGKLDAELYHRLGAFPLHVPSLRSRGEAAIRALAARMIQQQRFAIGCGPTRLADEALAMLASADWPGNIRQLREVIVEAFDAAQHDEVLGASHLRDVLARSGLTGGSDHGDQHEQSLEQIEKRHIARVLAQSGGNRSEAARILQITRTTLYKKISLYELEALGTE
jgi:DNA-binding NtrC family response regulator